MYLFLLFSEECFSIDQYEYDEDDPKSYIRTCKIDLNQSHNHSVNFKAATVEDLSELIPGWVSLSASLISITAMIVSLATYLLFNELRNIPGWNIINLTLALTLAQSAFLSGSFFSDIDEVCFAISLLTHYGFMASFFWMNVIAFDFYRNFRKKSSYVLLLTLNVKDRLPKYVLHGWISPLVFVSFTLLCDFVLGETKVYGTTFRPCYADFLKGCAEDSLNELHLMLNRHHEDLNENCLERTSRVILLKTCWIQNG